VEHRKCRFSTPTPLYCPLDSALHTQNGCGYNVRECREETFEYEIPAATQCGGGQTEQSRPGKERPFTAITCLALVLFFARLFARPLAS
jgi:hypothetical protein